MDSICLWFSSLDWKFIVGDILIPIGTFILGLILGKSIERKKAKAIIKGNHNTTIQNSTIETSGRDCQRK